MEAAIVQNAFRDLGLNRLAARPGVDVRQTALRVATDLFCQIRNPTAADIKRYTNLADGLLDCSDAKTRLEVAKRLVVAPFAPPELLQRLRRDGDVVVASVILAVSPVLPVDDVDAFLHECGPAEAAAIARRRDLEPQTVRLLAAHPHPLVAEALAENAACRFDASALASLIKHGKLHAPVAHALLAREDISGLALSPLYAVASPDARRRLLRAVAETPPQTSVVLPVGSLENLAGTIERRDRAAFKLSLAEALGVNAGETEIVLRDAEGDLLMLALSATGLTRTTATRAMLLFAAEEVRTSVARVFAAADLHDETPRWAARFLIDQVFEKRRLSRPTHEPHMHDSTTPQRASAGSKALNLTQREALTARR